MTAQSETGSLRRCLLRHPREAWRDQARVGAGWRELGFTECPDLSRAIDEYDRFVELLTSAGAEVVWLTGEPELTLDSIYVRDASIVSDAGAIACRMGKAARAHEPDAQGRAFARLDVPVLGRIGGEGRVEGGDVVWLDRSTLLVGLGYRTNVEGARQLRDLLDPSIEVLTYDLPHWRGSGDVFHLMSVLSPVDADRALVFSPLMPVRLRNELLDRGFELLEVPEAEVDMGPNAVAIAPGRVLLEAANVETRRRLEKAGVEVLMYEGTEISRKGLGGPTCLTRPLAREA